MKTMKKMMTVLVVLAMLLSLVCTSAYADITITGVKDGHKYTIYKLMDLTYDSAAGTYTYTVDTDWIGFFTTGAGKEYVALDTNNHVTWKHATTDDAAAKALAAAAVAANIKNDGEVTAASGSAVFAGLNSGYYVVKSTAGTFLTLNSVYGNTLSLEEKNNLPNVAKKVMNTDVSGASYAASADAEIGDVVSYKVVVSVKAGAKAYTVEDAIPAGITFNAESVNVYTDEDCTNVLAKENYDVDTTAGLKVTIKDAYLAGLNNNDKICITYTGTVNKDAVTGGAAESNKNTAVLKVSGVAAEQASAYVKTYKMDVFKYATGTTTPLEGAAFKLHNADNQYLKLGTNGEITWGEETSADVFTTPATGTFTIKGLMPGTYKLKETAAPAGYNLLAADETAAIDATDIQVTVYNSQTVVLPGTGGMGTTLFYAFGGILMAGAAVLLVSKKRRAN